MRDFKELIVWQRSCDAVEAAYEATRRFPHSEERGLTSQMRRAAVSVSANIAEGWARYLPRDQARCYRIALGSAAELECLIILAGRLRMASTPEVEKTIGPTEEVQRMLRAMIRKCVIRAATVPAPRPRP
jgi:four helix bundle protein